MSAALAPSVRFSEAEVLAAVKEKVGEAKCSLCGGTNWGLGYGFIVLATNELHNVNNLPHSGRGLSLVSLCCHGCGNTHLLNTLQLGITKPD